jgi:HK97 family phage portal protein
VGLRTRLAARLDPERADPTLSLPSWASMFSYAGYSYGGMPQMSLPGQPPREISQTFQGYVQAIYKSNGVVFACMAARQRLFSEARFQFRQMRNGRPGDLFGTQALQVLEEPWVNGTTGDLLSRAILDVDLEGNFYAYREGDRLRRLRPDWVSIALSGPPEQMDVDVIGYGYHPGGYNSGQTPIPLLPEQVLHWAPYPDPQARFRGMTWITPVLTEIQADDAASTHKLNFFRNGATPNMVLSMDPAIGKEAFDKFVDAFNRGHKGVENAYKTLFLLGGSSVTSVGSNMQQIAFKETQGAGETRIAAAAGVPPIIVGLSEGLQAATYSNYFQATRSMGDITMRPLWRTFCAAAANVVEVPGGATLWYDDRDIPFLQNDHIDAAQIQSTKASTLRVLLDSGYDPQSAAAAVDNNDFSLLNHTGLFSVQLQPVPTPEIYLDGVMAGIQAQDANTAKLLIDSGFTPDSVIKAILTQDFNALEGVEQVVLGPIATVAEGKGSLVSGTVVPAGASNAENIKGGAPQIPAMAGQNSVRALLEPWLPNDEETPDGE